MSRAENYAVGVVKVPLDVFWAYTQTHLPQGQFYTMGRAEVTETEIQITYSVSSAGVPPPPEQIITDRLAKEKEDGSTTESK